MTTDDVHGDDMAHPELSDEQLAALLDGNSDAPAGHPVADAIIRARQQLEAEPAPTPGAALSEFLGVGRVAPPIPQSVADGALLEFPPETDDSPRRTPVLTSLSAFIGTLTGKLLVSSTIAAASVGGAHAAGVVDIPGLPDSDPPSVTETLDPDDDLLADDRDDDELAADDDSDESDGDTDGADDGEPDDSDDSDDSDDDDSDDDDSDDPDDSPSSTTIPATSTTVPSTTSTTVPSTTSSTPTTSTSVPSSTTVPTGSLTKAYTVAGVGTTTVSVTSGQISLVSAVPASGWTLDEAGPDEDGIESTYTLGELETRIDFEIEDGQLRVRIRTRNDDTDERTERFEYFPI